MTRSALGPFRWRACTDDAVRRTLVLCVLTIGTGALGASGPNPGDALPVSGSGAGGAVSAGSNDVVAFDETQLDTPEREVARAISEVDGLLMRVEAGHNEVARAGFGPDAVVANRAFANGLAAFEHQEWLAAIREFNDFLNRSQVPEARRYLRAQFHLGRSYEEIGYPSRALRAYFRYLATYLTAHEVDPKELLAVLRRTLPLSAKSGVNDSKRLDELLSSATTLEWPPELRPEIYYFAAKAAAQAGRPKVAAGWLEPAENGVDPSLKARALYLRALLELNQNDFETAEDTLGQVAATDKEGTTRDLARLALARIALRQRRSDSALRLYDAIDSKSPLFKDALFESTYVLIERRRDKEARARAMLFLARWPDATEALQLQLMLAWLDMRAGEYEAAEAAIQHADQGLKDLRSWVATKLNGATTVSSDHVIELMQRSRPFVAPPPTVQEAYRLFARLAEAARRLADAHGATRNALYTVGRADLKHIRPAWVARGEQVAILGEEALAVGHRLAASERHLYWSSLNPVDQQRLTASESRRTRLAHRPPMVGAKATDWANMSSLFELTRRTADAWDRLNRYGAEVEGIRLAGAQAQGDAPLEFEVDRFPEMPRKRAELATKLDEMLSLIRKSHGERLARSGPSQGVRKFLAQYAVALSEEATIVAPLRDRTHSTASRLNAQDARRAWERWDYLMSRVFLSLDQLDQQVSDDLGSILTELEAETKQHELLRQRLTQLLHAVEQRLGTSLAFVVDQYLGAVDQRFARHKKWLADLDGLAYRRAVEDETKVRDKYELEQQILRDNLTDLQQGVLWQWPD